MKRIHSLFLFLIAIISFEPGCNDSPVDPAPVLRPAPKLLPKLALTVLRTADSIQLFKERPSSSTAAQQLAQNNLVFDFSATGFPEESRKKRLLFCF